MVDHRLAFVARVIGCADVGAGDQAAQRNRPGPAGGPAAAVAGRPGDIAALPQASPAETPAKDYWPASK